MLKTAITLGDPNGISPEITIKALNQLNLPKEKIIIIGNKCIFDFYKEKFNLQLTQEYEIYDIPFKKEFLKLGEETKEAGEFAFSTIKKACELANNNKINAIITAPISKNSIHLAKHNFSGQTEIIEHFTAKGNQKAEMLFMSDNINVLLQTRHIALKDVPKYITKKNIINKTEALNNIFINQLHIQNPKFAMCALNPHAGENGIFGKEEITEIIPAIEYLNSENIDIQGPFPSDALFTQYIKSYKENKPLKYNCYIAMYHDQGLIPIKMLEQDNCVNTTVGLDIIRTSPAHGTAFDIAGQNKANPNSMISAIKLALKYAN